MKKIIIFLIFIITPLIYRVLPFPNLDEQKAEYFTGILLIVIVGILAISLPVFLIWAFIEVLKKKEENNENTWKSDDINRVKFKIYKVIVLIFIFTGIILWTQMFLTTKYLLIDTFGALALFVIAYVVNLIIKKFPIAYSDGYKVVFPRFTLDKNIFGKEEFLIYDINKIYYGEQPVLSKKFANQLELGGLSLAENLLMSIVEVLIRSLSRSRGVARSVLMACVLEMKNGRKILFNLDDVRSFAIFMSKNGVLVEEVK